jgi:FOG: WD40-like repeat
MNELLPSHAWEIVERDNWKILGTMTIADEGFESYFFELDAESALFITHYKWHCINLTNGTIRWTMDRIPFHKPGAYLLADGVLYIDEKITPDTNDIVAIDPVKGIDKTTGKFLWNYTYAKENTDGAVVLRSEFGYDENTLVFTISTSMLIALNRKTGKLLWKKKLDITSQGITPFIWNERVYIQGLSGEYRTLLLALDVKTGQVDDNQSIEIEELMLSFLSPKNQLLIHNNVLIYLSDKMNLVFHDLISKETIFKYRLNDSLRNYHFFVRDNVLHVNNAYSGATFSIDLGTFAPLPEPTYVGLKRLPRIQAHITARNLFVYNVERQKLIIASRHSGKIEAVIDLPTEKDLPGYHCRSILTLNEIIYIIRGFKDNTVEITAIG